MKPRLLTGSLVVAAVAIAIFFGINAKVYPVATVDGGLISARSFNLAAGAAQTYYSRLLAPRGLSEDVRAGFQAEIRRIALQSLIDDFLITRKLESLYDAPALEAAIQQRVAGAIASSTGNIAAAAQELFGLTLEEFHQAVLAPQARVELLAAELSRDGVDPAAWFAAERAAAQVSVALSDLAWEDGQVALTGEAPYTAQVKELFEQLASTTQALQAVAPEEQRD